MQELLEDYMAAWKRMQTEKKEQGKPSAETVAQVVDLENKINMAERNARRVKR